MRRLSAGSAAALLLLGCAPLAAQRSDSSAVGRVRASPLLSADHWAVAAAWRLEGAGLAPDFFPAQGGASRAQVAQALRAGADARVGVAVAWLERFMEEFPEERSADPAALTWLGGAAGVGYADHAGRVTPAQGNVANRTGPQPLADRASALAALAGGIRVGDGVGAWAALSADEQGVQADRWEVMVTAGGAALSLGRAPVRYGTSGDGALVLGSRAALPRLELRSERPWRPGGVLRPLGRVTLHTFMAPLDEARHAGSPWLWGARVAIRPTGRVTLGVNRASMFGGDSVRVTAGRVAGMLVGRLTPGFENQLVSVDGRYRLPTDRVLPLNLYAEWAADDGAGAWTEQPAMLLGVEAPMLPGAPHLALGAEAAYFAACCGHGAWYNHWEFQGHWVARDLPLGHALGGEGKELALRGRAELLDARLRLAARGFARDRSDRSLLRGSGGGNLYALSHAGRSLGGALDVSLRLGARLEAALRLQAESGDEWREHAVELEMRGLF